MSIRNWKKMFDDHGTIRLSKLFPFIFAQDLAVRVGLLREESGTPSKEFMTEWNRLAEFQQSALIDTFEDCLDDFVGGGMNLEPEQEEVLKKIHRRTPGKYHSHLIGVVSERLENSRTANKDLSNVFDSLTEHLKESHATGNSTNSTGRAKSLIVHVTGEYVKSTDKKDDEKENEIKDVN